MQVMVQGLPLAFAWQDLNALSKLIGAVPANRHCDGAGWVLQLEGLGHSQF